MVKQTSKSSKTIGANKQSQAEGQAPAPASARRRVRSDAVGHYPMTQSLIEWIAA
jgi:hypothetical protein